MRKNLIYSFIVFLLLFVYLFAGFLTQLIMGAVKSELATFAIGASLALSTVIALIFFFAIRAIRNRFSSGPEETDYKPSSRFVAVASVFVAISLLVGVSKSYSDISEQRQVAESAKKASEAQKERMAALAEAERQRVAALTPEQRDAEAKLKAEQAKAAAEAAAKEAARKTKEAQEQAALKEKESADKAKRNFQMNLAGMGAKQLKLGMKDPDSFELKSLLFMPNGAACYEYRATNSFNAHLAGQAVLTSKGELLVHEQNGNAFVSAWNKECTVSGGEEIADLVKRVILN